MRKELSSRRKLSGVFSRMSRACKILDGDLSEDYLVIYIKDDCVSSRIASSFKKKYRDLEIKIINSDDEFFQFVKRNHHLIYGVVTVITNGVLKSLSDLSHMYHISCPIIALIDSKQHLNRLVNTGIEFTAYKLSDYLPKVKA